MKKPEYDPQTVKFPYSEYTDQHYLKLKKDNGVVFDENYPYFDNSPSFRFKRRLVRILLYVLVFLLARIRMGLKIEGRKHLKNNKALLKQGVVSFCNHVHMWDFIGVMRGIIPFNPRLLAWDKNLNGENAGLIRMVGGVPIPTNNLKGQVKFSSEVDKFLKSGGWLHIYPEACMWEYYRPIRPFKVGAANYAVKADKPILPMVYVYRKPGWIRRKIFGQIALFTLRIGNPIFVDKSLPQEERARDLTIRCHQEMVKLAGIKNNIYEPIFNHSKRIDYYATEYGVGYKGSF